jgi:serine/threonine protein kinase
MFNCCKWINFNRKPSYQNDTFSSIFPKPKSNVKKHNLLKKYKVNPINEISFKPECMSEFIGEGGCSMVYKYVYNDTVYACKKINRSSIVVQNEINIMSLYKDNQYIVKYFGCHLNDNIQTSDNKVTGPPKPHYIFMEYCRGKELFELLQLHLDIKIITRVIYQLLLAIKHLQKYKIVHADIKLENIVIDNNYSIKLIDFGLSKVITTGRSRRLSNHIGTIGYVSPEVMVDNYININTDIWSAGVLMFILLNNTHLFDVVNRDIYRQQLKNLPDTLQKSLIIYNNTVSIEKYTQLQSFLTKTICYVNDRYSTKKCLKHPIFSNVDETIKQTHMI